MSKKLLFNEGGDKVPVLNKYTGTLSNYPIEVNSELLDEKEKTYIEEIEGNTWQCDVVKIYDNGSKICSFTFKQAIDNPDTNMLEIYHTNDAFIETNESFIIQNNYKIRIRVDFCGYDADTYEFKLYIPDCDSFSSHVAISYPSIMKPIIEDQGYYYLEWINDTGSDITSKIKIQTYFGNYSVSEIFIYPANYSEDDNPDLSDIRSVGDTPLDEVYEIEVVQATCPYEFGKGGKL